MHLLLVNLRPLFIAEIKWIPHSPLLGSLNRSLQELVVDALLHHESGGGAAASESERPGGELAAMMRTVVAPILESNARTMKALLEQVKGGGHDGSGGEQSRVAFSCGVLAGSKKA